MREDLERKFARLTEFAAQRQEQADQVKSDMAGLRVTRRSADGLVIATVTASGQLVDLRIEDRALRSGRELAASVLNLVFQASADAAARVKELAAPLLADSSIDFDDLGVGATPPVRPDDLAPAQAPRPPARRPSADDDPDEPNPVIRDNTSW